MGIEEKRRHAPRRSWGRKSRDAGEVRAGERLVLERHVHGEIGRVCVYRRGRVSTREKNRKNGGRGVDKPETSAEAEQMKEEGADDDIVREFLLESNENLDSLDRELVSLEKDPKDRDTLSSIFRTIHTIKGTRTRIKPRRR